MSITTRVLVITGVIAFFATGYYTFMAVTAPSATRDAITAVQVTQVYNEAIYYALMAMLSGAVFKFCLNETEGNV